MTVSLELYKMWSRAWKQTQSDPASHSHTVNPILPIPPRSPLPRPPACSVCLGKQACAALLTSAASQLCTTMKLRVASCNLTHRR